VLLPRVCSKTRIDYSAPCSMGEAKQAPARQIDAVNPDKAERVFYCHAKTFQALANLLGYRR